MRFRLTLPLAELLIILLLAGIITLGACAWHIVVPGDGPSEFGAKDLRIEGTRLYDSQGRHQADWVTGEHGESGHWKSVPPQLE